MQALSTSWPFLCGGGKVRKKKSVEDWIIINYKPKTTYKFFITR